MTFDIIFVGGCFVCLLLPYTSNLLFIYVRSQNSQFKVVENVGFPITPFSRLGTVSCSFPFWDSFAHHLQSNSVIFTFSTICSASSNTNPLFEGKNL